MKPQHASLSAANSGTQISWSSISVQLTDFQTQDQDLEDTAGLQICSQAAPREKLHVADSTAKEEAQAYSLLCSLRGQGAWWSPWEAFLSAGMP